MIQQVLHAELKKGDDDDDEDQKKGPDGSDLHFYLLAVVKSSGFISKLIQCVKTRHVLELCQKTTIFGAVRTSACAVRSKANISLNSC